MEPGNVDNVEIDGLKPLTDIFTESAPKEFQNYQISLYTTIFLGGDGLGVEKM